MTGRARTAALALTATAALTLSACGADDDGAATTPTAETTTPEDTATPDDTGTGDTGTEDTTDDATTQPDGDLPPAYDGVLAAIDLAVAEHDAPAFEVDDGDGGIWEVHVAVGEDDLEVHVSADSTEILSSERESDLDSDDRAGLEAAGGFTLADAVRAAITEYGGTAPIDDVSISDEDDGTYAWEVAFTDDVEVYLDIATGETLRVETD